MKVGFIGLGRMGAAIAANVLEAGHQVTVFNRSAGKAEALQQHGATVARSIAEACRGEAVISMLANDAAVTQVVFDAGGVIDSLPQGSLHIGMSSISVALSRRLQQAHAKAGQRYVAAPVLGRPEAAAKAQLVVIAAGDAADLQACTPLFAAVGQHTVDMGEQPAAANLAKIGTNFLIASVIESLGEALALVAKGGIDPRRYLQLLTSTLFNAPVYKLYGEMIVERRTEPAGFAAPLGLKDMNLALSAGEELRVPMPIASLLRDRFLALLAQGGEQLDWSAIAQLAATDAGQGGADHPLHAVLREAGDFR
jgi:3-hydroxyisobutyrate dehydrogenase-like beta-hydroxyacid dehydrogenase